MYMCFFFIKEQKTIKKYQNNQIKMTSFGDLKVSNAVESGLDKAINAYHPNSTQKDQLDYLQTNVSVNGNNHITGSIKLTNSVYSEQEY